MLVPASLPFSPAAPNAAMTAVGLLDREAELRADLPALRHRHRHDR
jgi:hypothetical protein